jgi:hypothetical protein
MVEGKELEDENMRRNGRRVRIRPRIRRNATQRRNESRGRSCYM